MVDKKRVRLVYEAMDGWPAFVLHISKRLTAAADDFRVGEDVRAVKLLRAGIDDLSDFLNWVGEIGHVMEECGKPIPDFGRWQQRLSDGAKSVREAVSRGDFTTAADRIDAGLVGELMESGVLADQMMGDLLELREAA